MVTEDRIKLLTIEEEAGIMNKDKVKCDKETKKMLRFINSGNFKKKLTRLDVWRARGYTLPIYTNAPIYMTLHGFEVIPQEARAYNEDGTGFLMIGVKGSMSAFVSVADGSVHFFGKNQKDLTRAKVSIIRYSANKVFSERPYTVFEDAEVTPEPQGKAAEFLKIVEEAGK